MSGERGLAPFVVTIGETMVALVAEDAGPLRYASRFQRRAAGAESNVAIGLARLGVGTGWVSRVGDDELGRYVCAAVRGEGVDVSHVELDPDRPTGIARTVVEAGGTVSFDVNLRSQLGVNDPLAMFGPFIDLARFLFLGADEAEQLFRTHDTQDIEQELISLGVPTIILKLGANGARAYTAAEDRWIDAPGYKVPVVDEVGAGDAKGAK